ncbi:MAG: bifunctional diaminohydroxyphosphoribosylaminopyrimidine deaminase/5-amino-6-(5-phosphoribosylamino)uracil reductase RibD [Clostridiales bacterium]|jgi:diaminohydroxyphosphoribosylaminopyrimidine deaminase/5-amino-6-(5-phosphoribosylamino)uracil reductase|nr:bifunctional diaminohydroxyphosphoribosylaminopyrimidine deaminase/5-amino-6-(5-phosphoribosylamino)uracil reductase RibD [Eubacteriales bacterium]MDH7565343.1 bifunctional diaminohydroxyphosphoribosylaminopyrimidine deaminase/5-amino-6-(5-phosphoribosylamino)uracil reductase RibD [Clostridiales bacterium]
MNTHENYMNRALELAKGGWGKTNPNPLVGAVIVKNGRIIAEGFHKALGCAHAEVCALNSAEQKVEGSTLYVNLEPCSHYGRTPPCAKAIIEAGIKEVVVAMPDPNPKVSGRGIQMLRDAGINVTIGILEKEAKKLNEIFIKFITKNKPFVIMKAAMTLDGKIATTGGDSKWITGESSRHYVHVLRDRAAAIMVGINTVLKDNPSLTTRLPSKECKDPVRIIVDSKGRIPLDSAVINLHSNAGVILATTPAICRDKEKRLAEKGVRIIKAGGSNGTVDLTLLMDELYKLEIDSVLLEGGGALNASALNAGIVDKVLFFIAPKIIGGETAPTPVEGAGRQTMEDAVRLRDIAVTRFDEDVLMEGYINNEYM